MGTDAKQPCLLPKIGQGTRMSNMPQASPLRMDYPHHENGLVKLGSCARLSVDLWALPPKVDLEMMPICPFLQAPSSPLGLSSELLSLAFWKETFPLPTPPAPRHPSSSFQLKSYHTMATAVKITATY